MRFQYSNILNPMACRHKISLNMNMKLKTLFAAAFAVVGFCSTASAVTYPLPTDGSRLVGQNQVITIPEGNTQPLEYFAAEYQMGLSNMMEANPGVDTFLPKGGTVLNIPQQLILPDTVHEGIVINSAEMRLYYYPKGTNTVIVLPIGIGQLGKDTPINWTTKVERKKAGPTLDADCQNARRVPRCGRTASGCRSGRSG